MSDPAWLVRLAMRLGGQARVVIPSEVAERVRKRAERALEAYAQ